MTVYGGFEPGTYQPWALNLTQNALGGAGIARGMQVTPTSPTSMGVDVNVDATAGDGICFLANGGWLRIDATTTLSVPSNTSGSTRVDAVVAEVDPTGTSAVQLAYITSWATGFRGTGFGQGFLPNNQLVLALVSVPNGAVSIVAANITMTPLRASVGGQGPNAPQAIVADNSGTSSKSPVFSSFNVVLTTNALNGQTSFAIPLNASQRLVPMGKIGGANEVGFFAGPNGWYVPRLVASVSGVLPVASVDYVGGNLVSAVGVQSGETVTAAYKYYDFANDLGDWGNAHFLERDSPYVVYQSDALPGTSHLTNEVWNGTRNSILMNVGDTLIIAFLSSSIMPMFRGGGGVGAATYTAVIDGVSQGSHLFSSVTDLPFYSTGNAWFATTPLSPSFISFTINAGQTEYGGSYVVSGSSLFPSFVFDGGSGVVEGFPVYAGSTSVQLNNFAGGNGATGVIYLDRFGNVTASLTTQALGESVAGRVPVAQAIQAGGLVNTSTWYGTYPLPNQPLAQRPAVLAGSNANALVSSALNHGWQITSDATSPYGAYLTCTSANDILTVAAYGSGLDMTMLAPTITTVNVIVRGITSYFSQLTPANTRLHLTTCSGLPPQTLLVSVANMTGGSFSVEEAAIRQPAFPSVPTESIPLSYFYLPTGASWRRNSWVRSLLKVVELSSGDTRLVAGPINQAPGSHLWMSNITTGENIQATVNSYTSGRIAFMGGPNTGIALIHVSNQTATFDTYQPSYGLVTTAWFSGANGSCFYSVESTGTKNTSSSGKDLYPVGVDSLQYPALFIDARPQPVDGVHSSLRGSAILGSQGEVIGDVAYGISTSHLQDRAVNSRKLAPTLGAAVSTTAYSGFTSSNHLDPNCVTSVTVEVPSVLLIGLAASPSIIGGSGATLRAAVDGVVTGPRSQTNGGSTENRSLALTAQVVVGPGAHTVQVWLDAFAGAAMPYFANGEGRSVSVVAFAL